MYLTAVKLSSYKQMRKPKDAKQVELRNEQSFFCIFTWTLHETFASSCFIILKKRKKKKKANQCLEQLFKWDVSHSSIFPVNLLGVCSSSPDLRGGRSVEYLSIHMLSQRNVDRDDIIKKSQRHLPFNVSNSVVLSMVKSMCLGVLVV